jgi:small-conductance mechanosensitive channel
MDQTQFIQDLLARISPIHLLEAVLVLLVAWAAIRLLGYLLNRLSSRFNRYRLHFSRLFPILRLVVWAFAIGVIIFSIFRPQQNAVLALSASLGIAIGLAAQDAIKNWLAGLFMLFNRPYQLGDMVHAAGYYGEVIGIDMSVTRLRTFDDNVVVLPNGEILKQAIANANDGELFQMVVVQLDLPATVDVTQMREIAWEAAAASPYSYLKRPVSVTVSDRFDHTFLTRFKVKVYVIDVRLEPLLQSDIIERIKHESIRRGLLSEQMIQGLLHTGN